MTHRLTTNYAKNYCNRTLIVKVIVENVVTCFLGHGVETYTHIQKRFKAITIHHYTNAIIKIPTRWPPLQASYYTEI